MFDYFGNEIDFSLKAVSVLNWKNVARPKNEKRFLTSKFRLFATETVFMQSEICSVLTFQTLIGN